MLVDIKLEIHDNDNYEQSEFTTTVGKVLLLGGLCVTRWTCQGVEALKHIYSGYFSQIKGFAHICSSVAKVYNKNQIMNTVLKSMECLPRYLV